MTQPSPPTTVEDLRKAREAEWGTYVALVPIDLDGVRAFNPGDPVPVTHVTGGVVGDDLVAKTTTKAGRAAAGIDDPEKG